MSHIFRAVVSLLICLLLPLTAALAADGAKVGTPTGRVILTVSGKIDVKNVEDTAQFDIETLRNLPVVSVSTSTIWTEGVHVFTGVPLASLLEIMGNSGSTLRASAINDYSVDIPVAEIGDDWPILAYEMNGKPMHRRDKGPLWIIYPYDRGNAFQTSEVYSRSVWQLDRLLLTD